MKNQKVYCSLLLLPLLLSAVLGFRRAQRPLYDGLCENPEILFDGVSPDTIPEAPQVESPPSSPSPIPSTEEAPSQPPEETTSAEALPPPLDESTYHLNAYEQEVIALVNEIRREHGLSELSVHEELSRVAREKSEDMRRNGYFDHTSPTYGTPFEMMRSFGISYRTAGENIAMGYATPEAVVTGWMNSEGHRKNILNPTFTTIGVGYVPQGHYATQMFLG